VGSLSGRKGNRGRVKAGSSFVTRRDYVFSSPWELGSPAHIFFEASETPEAL